MIGINAYLIPQTQIVARKVINKILSLTILKVTLLYSYDVTHKGIFEVIVNLLS